MQIHNQAPNTLTKVRKRQLSSIQQNILETFTDNIELAKTNNSNSFNNQLFLAQILKQSYLQCKNSLVASLVNEAIKLRQDKVYDTTIAYEDQIVNSYFSYLQVSSLDKRVVDISLLKLKQRQDKVVSDILRGETQLNKIRKFVNEKNDCQSKNKQTISKEYSTKNYSLGSLNLHSQLGKKKVMTKKQLHQVFRSESLQTQLVSKYVKQKMIQRKQIQNRAEISRTMKLKKEQDILKQQKQKEEQKNRHKKQSLVKLFEERLIRRNQYNEERKQRQFEYKKILKRQKPLYQKLLLEDNKNKQKQQQQLNNRIKDYKKCLTSIDSEELNRFQQQYLMTREQKEKLRQQNLQIKLQQVGVSKRYYRSKFHQFIERSSTQHQQTESEQSKLKHLRRVQYSRQIKQKIKVSIDEKLREELKNAIIEQANKSKKKKKSLNNKLSESSCINQIEGHTNHKTQNEEQHNSKLDGLKFLKYAKEKRNKTVSMKQSQIKEQPKTDVTLSHSHSRIYHLTDRELLNKFISGVKQSNKTKDIKKDLLKAKAFELDEKAHRSQQILKFQQGDFHKSYPDPEQYYIDAIRTKIEYLKL